MLNPNPSSHSDPDALTRFHQELARAGGMPGLAPARRALQHRWRRSLGGTALLCALGRAPATLAAQINVSAGGCTATF